MVVNYFIEGFNSSRLREQLRLRQHQNYTYACKHVIDLLTDNLPLRGGKGQYEADGKHGLLEQKNPQGTIGTRTVPVIK
jgi:hypothetical protein